MSPDFLALRNRKPWRALRLRISLVIQGTGNVLVLRLATTGACWLYRFDRDVLKISSGEVKSKMTFQGTLLMSIKRLSLPNC